MYNENACNKQKMFKYKKNNKKCNNKMYCISKKIEVKYKAN